MDKFLNYVRFSLALCLAMFITPTLMAQQDDLHVSIQPVDSGVEFSLTNIGVNPISVLTWETPLEAELSQDVFVVTPSDGGNRNMHARRAVFSGRMFKRADPVHSDYLTIAAGKTKTVFVPLAEYYQLSEEGNYHVSFAGAFQVLEALNDRSILSHSHDLNGLNSVYKSTSPVSVDLTPQSVDSEVFYASASGYSGCTAEQQAELPLDFNESERITREAKEALQGLPENERAGSPRYLHWFGTYNSSRYESVIDTYTRSEALMGAGEVDFVCDCEEPYFAFIRRTEPFKVNLCTFYWLANRTGTDSRAGTILHEVSHFNEIAGTADHAYGANDVSNLALINPSRAVNNADSIEYFAENTPFREISAGITAPPPPVVITSLPYDVATSGSVLEDASIRYQVNGAADIRLTTNSGDADLYVYSDDGFVNQICNSILVTSVDSCVIGSFGVVYVEVYGYENSDFSITAQRGFVDLRPGEVQTVSIASSEQQFYTVNAANFVQVNSLSGDADVYVYSSADRTESSLTCSSRNTLDVSPLDTCEINGTAYVTVLGVQAGQYSIFASTDDPRPPEPPVDTGIALQFGQSQAGTITVGERQTFTLTDANFVQVNSLSGDADVFVYSSPDRNDSSLVCSSNARSDVSGLDTCEINGTGYVTVFGVQSGQYTIAALASDPRITDSGGGIAGGGTVDDGGNGGGAGGGTVVTTQSGTASSGGGGLFGPVGLMFLLLASGFVRRILHRLCARGLVK